MRPVQVRMDEELIRAVDREARRRRLDRSKLVRAALARFVDRRRSAALERQHVRGYQKVPQDNREISAWERVQVWPDA